ncbi:MAG: hypothetical protein A2Z72_05250 [Omnitrophica bacterium RBG_13_46_9]|nr:MAG: hypothetical protein A2Z72_05250 [Omnitrophica bacterium RBG_13_46_9]
MKKIYFYLFSVIALCVILVITVFIFLEREKHQNLFYTIEVNGEVTGYIKADLYQTENKILYKSASFYPKEPDHNIINEKVVFSKENFRLEKFFREYRNLGTVTETLQIANTKKSFDFLAEYGSTFGFVSNIPHAKNISFFDKESLLTYMPFVERYDFTRGGAQSFNALFRFIRLLPPVKGRVVFTSIRDEYINVEGKKAKTECLVVKTKLPPESYIWVLKKDRSIAQMEISSKSLLVRRVACLPKISFQYHKAEGPFSYDSQIILFPSADIALSGTIALPRKEGKLPAVLLVVGEEEYTRENAGLYTDISHQLAQEGYIVMRYDRRGIGNSQGDNMSSGITNEINDIESSLGFLLNNERVDRNKIFIIAHSEACSYLPQIDFSRIPVRGMVMLAIKKPSVFVDFESDYVRDTMKDIAYVDKEYPGTLELLKEQTQSTVKNTNKECAVLQGELIFIKKMGQLLEFKPLEGFKKLGTPLIIVQGKKDKFGSPTYVKNIKDVLDGSGLCQYSLLQFRGLGFFLGDLIDEKNKAKYYKLNAEVMQTTKDWIRARCIDPKPESNATP